MTNKYIVLGIRDQGGCRTLYSVKISYKVCIEKTLEDSLVSLPSKISQLKPTPVQGICGENSFQIVHGNLTVLCDSDGEWNTNRLESRCVCKEGMENTEGICTGMIWQVLCLLPRFSLSLGIKGIEILNLCCLFYLIITIYTYFDCVDGVGQSQVSSTKIKN